jgi:hypothetical protein
MIIIGCDFLLVRDDDGRRVLSDVQRSSGFMELCSPCIRSKRSLAVPSQWESNSQCVQSRCSVVAGTAALVDSVFLSSCFWLCSDVWPVFLLVFLGLFRFFPIVVEAESRVEFFQLKLQS